MLEHLVSFRIDSVKVAANLFFVSFQKSTKSKDLALTVKGKGSGETKLLEAVLKGKSEKIYDALKKKVR